MMASRSKDGENREAKRGQAGAGRYVVPAQQLPVPSVPFVLVLLA